MFYFAMLTLYSAKAIIVPHRIIWSWYTGRWWVGCYIWYSKEVTGQSCSPPESLLAVPNVTAHLSTASVPITVLLYNDPLLCGCSVFIKGLNISYRGSSIMIWNTGYTVQHPVKPYNELLYNYFLVLCLLAVLISFYRNQNAMVLQISCIPLKISWSSLMRSYFLVRFALVVVYIICYIQIDRHGIYLRSRGHSFDVPRCNYDLTRKSFIFRSLSNYRWFQWTCVYDMCICLCNDWFMLF